MNTISQHLSSGEREVIENALKAYSWAVSGAERNEFVEQLIEKLVA
jgi:hypothetical protein